MANEYTDLAVLKAWLNIDVADTTRDVLLNKAREAAARAIDNDTGRRFWLDDEPSARTYTLRGRVSKDVDGLEGLIVDDIGDDAGLIVEVGSGSSWTVLPATAYELEPDNAMARGIAATVIRLNAGGTWGLGTGQRARITVRWGWPSIVAEVDQASLLQSARFYSRKNSTEGVAGNSEWGLVRVTRTDPDVFSLISSLVRPGMA